MPKDHIPTGWGFDTADTAAGVEPSIGWTAAACLTITAACCCCALAVFAIALCIWIFWVLYDTYTRGVTEIPCAEDSGIWWYIVLMYIVSLAMTSVHTCMTVVLTLRKDSMDAKTFVEVRRAVFLVQCASYTIYIVGFIVWGMFMWQRMPAECTAQYEQEFPDLLLLFHFCKQDSV